MLEGLNKGISKIKIFKKPLGTKIMASILVVTILAGIAASRLIMSSGIKKQNPPEYKKIGIFKPIGEIKNNSGVIPVARNEGKELYIDTKTLNIKLVDTNTGIEWNSIYNTEESGVTEKSPIIIKYLGKDSTSYEWNAYKYCIENGRYKLNKIDNGVQIIFDFYETESYRLNEYMPSKISIQKYEEEFINKMKQKVEEGKISNAEAALYKTALEMTYQKDEDNNCYFIKFAGVPPVTLVKKLIEFSKAVEYTQDMLIADSSEFGLTVSIVEPARFIVTMDVTLDKGDLVVNIPTYEIKSGNEFYTMQNISVLPSLGLVSANSAEDGYIFVPDGSGALFKLNTFNPKYPEYERPIYNNTYYDTLYEMSEYPENLHMPVFGMYYNTADNKSQGYMGIIENGAELAHVKVQLGTKDTSSGGTPYNKVYSSVDSSQFSRVKVFGPYSDNDTRYLVSTGLINVDYTVRYKFFNDNVTYYDMAKAFKDYLAEKNNIKLAYSNAPKLFLDVIGTLTLERKLLGVPYEKLISMTKYNELLDIMNDLKDVNKVVNYKGFFNNGMNNTIFNEAELMGTNGDKKDLDKLLQYFDGKTNEIYFNTDFMRISNIGGPFNTKANALYGFDGKPLKLRKYDYVTRRFNLSGKKQYLLNPLFLTDTVDKFIKDSKNYSNIFVNDMGSLFYANYNPKEIVNPVAADMIINENLKKLSENKTVALDNPNIDKISYAKYAANISRESSDYATMYCSIPFRQLVMNGLVEYTTLNVNMASNSSDYFLLQTLELGSIPKFTISSKNIDVLKNSEFSDYNSMEYSLLKDKIKTLYEKYSTEFEKIGSSEIVNHSMLDKNVFETTYASGVSVIVNYNKYQVNVSGYNLDPLDYMIVSKR